MTATVLDAARIIDTCDALVITAERLRFDDYVATIWANDLGHPGLISAVDLFSASWRTGRDELGAQLVALESTLRNHCSSFEQADSEVAAELATATPPAPAAASPLAPTH